MLGIPQGGVIDEIYDSLGLTHAMKQSTIAVRTAATVAALVCLWIANEVPAQRPVVEDQERPRRVDSLGDPMPERALIRMGSNRFRSPGSVMDMALSGDGQVLVTIGDYLTAWDAMTGRELWRASSQRYGGRLNSGYGIRDVALSADAKSFVTFGAESGLVSWDARTGKSTKLDVPTPPANGRTKRSIDITNDGKLFAVGNAMGLFVCNASGDVVYTLDEPSGPPVAHHNRDRLNFGGSFHYAIFAPDGSVLARVASGEGKTIFLHDAASGDELRTIACDANVVRMDFSPDGKQIAATQRDTSVGLYDVASGERVWKTKVDVDETTENYTSAIKFSPDGKWLAVSERQQQLLLLDAATGVVHAKAKDHSWNPWAVTFSADSKTLYSAGWGGVVHRWSVDT
ncbi:MAG: WD40 repeat domain-containing protein, partial [Pirellulaceae bacterium]|nr:WD40 repeat domain-containing protein [Pirellulaceae bacterium]